MDNLNYTPTSIDLLHSYLMFEYDHHSSIYNSTEKALSDPEQLEHLKQFDPIYLDYLNMRQQYFKLLIEQTLPLLERAKIVKLHYFYHEKHI